MDRHDIPGATAQDVAEAHVADLAMAAKYNVQFLSYWFDEAKGTAFCIASAPEQSVVADVHREAHGLIPSQIIAVSEDNLLRFLGKIEEPEEPSGRAFRTVLFTDLEGSTALLQELGESGYMEMLGEHDLIIRRSLNDFRGREVKHTGDGIMASFSEVDQALQCSRAIQAGFSERNAPGPERDMSVRIGMAAGEPVDRNDDLFGSTVNLASRICDAADAGAVVVSDVVRDLGLDHGFEFSELDSRTLKGFTEPTRMFALQQ